MDIAKIPDLGFTWDDLLEMLQTAGVELVNSLASLLASADKAGRTQTTQVF